MIHFSVVLSAMAAVAKAFPYQEEGYSRGGDLFGEAGLNAVSLNLYVMLSFRILSLFRIVVIFDFHCKSGVCLILKVPRIGKRVARHSNPYDAFRFRFNDGTNWFGRGLAGGNAGFR